MASVQILGTTEDWLAFVPNLQATLASLTRFHESQCADSGTSAGIMSNTASDTTSNADFLDFFPYADGADDVEAPMALDTLAPEKSAPMVDMIALLANMSQYEKKICGISNANLDDYPIGDGLFLFHRFSAVISQYDWGSKSQSESNPLTRIVDYG
ncbi:hypothetical protein DV737_g3769, partial [Chaetothyriales sp. CBS 132003]